MILKRPKKLTMIDFFGMLEFTNFPKKDEEALKSYPIEYDCTWKFFKKYGNFCGELNRDQSENIREVLANLEDRAKEIFSRNNLGKMDPWVLFTVYLEEVNNKPVISFGFEHNRTKKVLSFSIPI